VTGVQFDPISSPRKVRSSSSCPEIQLPQSFLISELPEPPQQAVSPGPPQQAVSPEPPQRALLHEQLSEDAGSSIQTSYSLWLITNALVPSNDPNWEIRFPDMPPTLSFTPPPYSQQPSYGQVQTGPGCFYSDQSTARPTSQQTIMHKRGSWNRIYDLEPDIDQG